LIYEVETLNVREIVEDGDFHHHSIRTITFTRHMKTKKKNFFFFVFLKKKKKIIK